MISFLVSLGGLLRIFIWELQFWGFGVGSCLVRGVVDRKKGGIEGRWDEVEDLAIF